VPRRRACLVVPAAPAAKLAKGHGLEADEIVIDLEDAVVPAAKDEAREAVVAALGEEFAAPSVAVRVNAIGTPWCHVELAAVAASGREHVTVVLPKVEHPHDLAFADRLLAGAEAAAGRAAPVRLLALIETAAGLQAAGELARASARLDGLILGYADLAASLGRPDGGGRAAGPDDWRFAQDAVLVAARAAGVQAIDGPHLAIRDDEPFRAEVAHARALGYDGKWAIHPNQVPTLHDVFTPSADDLERAQRIVDAADGAIRLDGEMVDEATKKLAAGVLARARGHHPER